MLELEGGGKYDWIKIEDKRIVNSTLFEAKNYQIKILEIVNPNNSIDSQLEIGEHLYNRLKQKDASIQKFDYIEDKVKQKFIDACKLGYFLYEDKNFLELAKLVKANIKIPLIEENSNNSRKEKNEQTNSNELLEIFDRELEKVNPQAANEHHGKPDSYYDDRRLEQTSQNATQEVLKSETEGQELRIPISLLQKREEEDVTTASIDYNGINPKPSFPLKVEFAPATSERKPQIDTIPLDPPRSPGLFKPHIYNKPSKDILSKWNKLDTSAKVVIRLTIVVAILVIVLGTVTLLLYNFEMGVLFILLPIFLLACAFVIREFLK